MNTYADKVQEKKGQAITNAIFQKQSSSMSALQFVDNRQGAIQMQKMQEVANNYSKNNSLHFVDNRPQFSVQRKLDNMVEVGANSFDSTVLQAMLRRKVPYKSEDASEARAWRMEDRGIKGRNIATLFYTILSTDATMATSEHSMKKHSEKLIMEELIKLYGEDYKTKLSFQTLYTERDACGADYHNCREHIQEWFPGVRVTYSADYPAEADVSDDSASDSGSESKRRHRRKKAKKRRARGTAKVKRADKYAGTVASAAPEDWEAFDDSADDDDD